MNFHKCWNLIEHSQIGKKFPHRVRHSAITAALDATVEQDYVAPRSQVEELLAKIWAKVLGKEQVGVHDNFFELGGHSLLATQLTSRIRDTFQIDLPVRNLFETPTVGQLARYIDTMCWAAKGVDKTETTGIQREEVEF